MAMGRRSRGDGAVFYDESRGCWVGQVDLGRDPDTGKRRRPKVSGETKTEAKEKLDKLREEKRKTGTVAKRNTTVKTVVNDSLEHPPPTVKSPISKRIHRNAGDRIIAELGHVKLTSLSASQVERFLAGMVAEGLSTSTISITRAVLVRAIKRAMRDDLVGRNVAALVPCPVGTRKPSKAMTVEQAGKLIAVNTTPWWSAYVLVAVALGLRPGELLGLRWEDVDLDELVLRVRKRLDEETLTLVDLKTEESRRTLKMPQSVAAALRTLKAWQAAERLRRGSDFTDNGLVFCSANGAPKWGSEVRRRFKRLCDRAGIGSDWHCHEQRHTFVSVLSDGGVDIEHIADAVGHKNSNVTKTVYRHVISDKISTAADVMDGIFKKKASGEQ
jgi:integrase